MEWNFPFIFFLFLFDGFPQGEHARHQVRPASGAGGLRQVDAPPRHLHGARRHTVRPDGHQHRGEVPGQVRPQHAPSSGVQGQTDGMRPS